MTANSTMLLWKPVLAELEGMNERLLFRNSAVSPSNRMRSKFDHLYFQYCPQKCETGHKK